MDDWNPPTLPSCRRRRRCSEVGAWVSLFPYAALGLELSIDLLGLNRASAVGPAGGLFHPLSLVDVYGPTPRVVGEVAVVDPEVKPAAGYRGVEAGPDLERCPVADATDQ
jgi:hypothetical protein